MQLAPGHQGPSKTSRTIMIHTMSRNDRSKIHRALHNSPLVVSLSPRFGSVFCGPLNVLDEKSARLPGCQAVRHARPWLLAAGPKFQPDSPDERRKPKSKTKPTPHEVTREKEPKKESRE